MRTRDACCTYIVMIDRSTAQMDELREFSTYLSSMTVSGCETIVIDSSSPEVFDENGRVLRWVAKHISPRPRFRTLAGALDPIRAALDVASCEKVILAGAEVRYSATGLQALCAALEMHEVVEPQDYLDPLPWWGGIEAGRMLVHRGIVAYPDHGSTFGFRRSAIRGLRTLDACADTGDDYVRRLSSQGAEVHSAADLFVRRYPPRFAEWLKQRPRQADDDFAMPVKTAFFFALIPMALLLTLFGGLRLAEGYAGAVAFASLTLALRGRIGATNFFPLRICLFAPLWVLERSVSVYWALLRNMRGGEPVGPREPALDRSGERAVNG